MFQDYSGSHGLVLEEGHSCSRGHEFESGQRIQDELHMINCINKIVYWTKAEKRKKEAWDGPFKLHYFL